MLAKIQFNIIPLCPKITPFNQVLMLISKIKVSITDDNLPSINANNEVNIKDIFLFFITLITLANTTPSNIKKYNVGGIGMFVRK